MNDGITLIYLSLKHEVYHRQTVFSVLSFFYQTRDITTSDISVVIYSDNILFFEKRLHSFPVILVLLDTEEINDWFKEGSGNNHISGIDIKTSLKIIAIKKSMETYGQNVFYFDDDTFFIKNPIPFLKSIGKGKTCMYIKEGILQESGHDNWEKLRCVLKEKVFEAGHKSLKIPLDTAMWNAGVIGISIEDCHLLNHVLNLAIQLQKTDEHPYLYHDQIMFSYVFQTHTQIMSSTNFLYHYYLGFEKDNFNRTLKKLFLHLNNKNKEEIFSIVSQIINTPISKNEPAKNTFQMLQHFIENRNIGLRLACNRVKKTGKLRSFFHRGKV